MQLPRRPSRGFSHSADPSRCGRAIAGASRNRSSLSPSPKPIRLTRSGLRSRPPARPVSARTACRKRSPNGATCGRAPRRLGKTIELHLIGPLQSNKAREAVETFDVIETVDREKIAAALAREIDRVGKRPRLFVEVNTGGEAQKAGVLPEEADAFIALCQQTYGLTIGGLMAIPPANEMVSPHFALLSVIAKRNGLTELFYGHERRLAACGAARRDVCPRRFRDFRCPRFTSLKRESADLHG